MDTAPSIRITISRALDALLQRAFPETASEGYAQYRVEQACLTFLRDRGIAIVEAVTLSRRTPPVGRGHRSHVRSRRPAGHGRRHRRR